MMRRMLGAPLGGITRGGHQGVESLALSVITPPNFGGGGGICLPSMVVVALGEPGVPVTCCAETWSIPTELKSVATTAKASVILPFQFVHCILVVLLHLQKHMAIFGAESEGDEASALRGPLAPRASS